MDIDTETKRIKLSLEPNIKPPPWNITEKGEEIFKAEEPATEKFMQQAERIWFERGEWQDISEESLSKSIVASESLDDQDPSTGKDEEKIDAAISTATVAPAGVDIMKLRTSIVTKLEQAKQEIDVALDVINILVASSRPELAAKDLTMSLVLPPRSIYATYVSKPQPSPNAQLETIQLTMGLKRKQQKAAAKFMKKRAQSLGKILETEYTFWKEALDLRRNRWQILARPFPIGPQWNSTLYVQYGFAEGKLNNAKEAMHNTLIEGSRFTEPSLAELARSNDDKETALVSIPHDKSSRVIVTIHRRTDLDANVGNNGRQFSLTRDYSSKPCYLPQSHNIIQQRLEAAQATVFDAELFAKLQTEAQIKAMKSAKFTDDRITIGMDEQTELVLEKVSITEPDKSDMDIEEKPSHQDAMSDTIDLSLRLLLLQQHRQSTRKTRSRLFSIQRKLQGNDTSSENLILTPILDRTRFWMQFERLRGIVNDHLRHLNGWGGLKIKVHFDFHPLLARLDQGTYGTLTIHFFQGPVLRFALDVSGTVTISLRQLKVTLSSTAEFEACLQREIRLACLDTICQSANRFLQQSDAYKLASPHEIARFLWQVDEVEEALNGSVPVSATSSKSPTEPLQWKNVHATVVRTNEGAHVLQIRLGEHLDASHDTRQWPLCDMNQSTFSFSERVQVLIETLQQHQG